MVEITTGQDIHLTPKVNSGRRKVDFLKEIVKSIASERPSLSRTRNVFS